MRTFGASRAASLGLAGVVLCLAAFAIFAAYTTRTQAERAERSDLLAHSYEHAISVFSEEERSKLAFFLDPSQKGAVELEKAGNLLAAAINDITVQGGQEDAALARDLLALQQRYLVTTERLLGAMAAGDQPEARRINEGDARPLFLAMRDLLTAAADERLAENRAALSALGNTARWLLIVTPVVFTIGFALLLGLWRILSQNDRATQKTYREIEQLSTLRAEFVATVSHEFRTPLTGIQGFSEMMRDEELTVAQMREYASDINKDARRLARLMSDMLDLDRMESGLMTPKVEPVNLNGIVRETVAQFRSSPAAHRIELDLDEGLPTLSGDSDRLIQVVTNLLSNAIKYSPDGGTIELRTRREEQAAMLTVRDHGTGIAAEHLERIFERYYRIESAATRGAQGTGLGLPIVRQIVQLYRGRVWATSGSEEGSTFHVQFPLVA